MTSRIAFIENKGFDVERINDLLLEARAQNHYANFGPNSVHAEQVLLELLQIAPELDFSSVFCSSGTAALNAAAATLNAINKRACRWIVSANGFYSTRIGPFSKARAIDCDGTGLMNLEALAAIPSSSYDGVVYTNLFGYFENFEPIIDFCDAHNKSLIIDNAASLGSLKSAYRFDALQRIDWVEVFSFHQTKPWGMGEGGAAVMPARLKESFRGAINFGVDHPEIDARFVANSKISEFACALIISRLETLEEWASLYREQAKRIMELGQLMGFQPIVDSLPPNCVPAHVPLFSDGEIQMSTLAANKTIALQKYYRPLDWNCFNAVDYYRRTVSVPCHPGVAALSDEKLIDVLREVSRETSFPMEAQRNQLRH